MRSGIGAAWRAEEQALERGDIDEAVELNRRVWVDGPFRDSTSVDSELRGRVGEHLLVAAGAALVHRAAIRRDAKRS